MNNLKQISLFMLLQLYFAISAFGGSGSITPAPTNPYGIVGLMNFTVNFRSPPSQVQLDQLSRELLVANNMLCDATDGQIVLGKVTVNAGAVNESLADMWIFPQAGRAGVQIWFDGSGLTKNGSHINMFGNSITGEIIAHELAHLAFGILDEYSEQCRWGGPCGIGQCMQNDILDDRNNNLMQQTAGDASELCVPSNHDLVRGDGMGCPINASCVNTGMCDDQRFCNGYNNTNNRYETTQQTIYQNISGWETLVRNMRNTYGLDLTMPAGLPVAEQPANCDFFFNIENQVNGTNLVVLTIDKSGSMKTQDVGERTRLQFTQAAAKAFLDLQVNNNLAVGLVTFNETATTERRVLPLNASNISNFKNQINAITASGNTAVGDGLYTSGIQLEVAQILAEERGETISNPTVFLLSDGENNRGPNPKDIAEAVRKNGVTVHTIAAGDGANTSQLSDIATATGGSMLPAGTDDLIPPTYAEFAAQHQGMSMINIINITSTTTTPPGVEFASAVNVFKVDFLVESGAEELTLFRSLRDNFTRTSFLGEQVAADTVRGVLNYLGFPRDPDGFTVSSLVGDFLYDENNLYQIITIPNPKPGIWTYFIEQEETEETPKFHFRGFIQNSTADYFLDASPAIVQQTDTNIIISANASFGASLLDTDIIYSGYVLRPDSTTVDINFSTDPFTGAINATFNDFNGRGLYKVFSSLSVPQNASYLPGESIFSGPEQPNNNVEAFTRMATSSFFVDIAGCPACDNDDCDDDNIPNAIEEPFGDLDNDGLPCGCDEDCDGDDIPDQQEGTGDDDGDGIPNFADPITDNNCTSQNELDLFVEAVSQPDCNLNNGQIRLDVSGNTTNITYRWLGYPDINTPSVENLPAGKYIIEATNENGCQDIQIIDLEDNCLGLPPTNPMITLNCPTEIVAGCTFPIKISVDMNNISAPNDALGSFTARIIWNTAELQYNNTSQLLSNFNGFINDDLPAGQLIFNGANPDGATDIIDIFQGEFIANGSTNSNTTVQVEFLAMAAAKTFSSLLESNPNYSCNLSVTPAGLLGDVNNDGLVNSTDGNIVLSFDANLPIFSDIQERIDGGFGDVNNDGLTNSADALIILSYDAQISVPFPIGINYCPPLTPVTSDAETNERTEESIEVIWSMEQLADEIEIPVLFDLSDSDHYVGSYKLSLKWNTEALDFVNIEADLAFKSPVINDSRIEQGELIITNAQPNGKNGLLPIIKLFFKQKKLVNKNDFQIDVSSLADANDFTTLSSNIKYIAANTTTEILEEKFSVFPNPFSFDLNLQYFIPTDTLVKIELFDTFGKRIESLANQIQKRGTHDISYSVDHRLPSGLYFVRAELGTNTIFRKVILTND